MWYFISPQDYIIKSSIGYILPKLSPDRRIMDKSLAARCPRLSSHDNLFLLLPRSSSVFRSRSLVLNAGKPNRAIFFRVMDELSISIWFKSTGRSCRSYDTIIGGGEWQWLWDFGSSNPRLQQVMCG